MARVVKPVVEVFPPSDRELALRAQIKTGWSTISNHDVVPGLNPNELKHIHQVLEKAQAMEHMEQIRIGLQVLKHKQNIDRCRGDGVTTCRICNRDFTNKRSHKSEPIQYCVDCQMVTCSRCRIPEKVVGDNVMLCNICYEERELWKKSGSWLNNTVPDFDNFTIPVENLEEIQEKMTTTRKLSSRRREQSEFVNPFQIGAEDQDDDDEGNISPPLSDSQRIDFTPSPSRDRKDMGVDLDFMGSHSRSSSMDESTGITDLSSSFPRSRESGFTRRRAISKADKSRLMTSRERARSTSRRHGSGVPSPSLRGGAGDGTSSTPPPIAKTLNGEADGSQPSVPSIKIRKPSTQAAPYDSRPEQSSPHHVPLQPIMTGDSDTEAESNKGFKVIRQMQKMSSTESDVMVVGGEYLPTSSSPQANVEQSITTTAASAARKQWATTSRSSSSSSSPEHMPLATQKSTLSGSSGTRHSSKLEHPSEVKGEKGPTMTGSQPTPDKKPTSDLFRKVGGASPSSSSSPQAKTTENSDSNNTLKSSKSPEPEKKSDSGDLFKKVGGAQGLPSKSERSPSLEKKGDTSDIFKKVGGSPVKSERSPSLEKKNDVNDGFKKVGVPVLPVKPDRSPSLEKKGDTSDGFKKVGVPVLPTKSERSPSLEKKGDAGDIFKKVGGSPSKPEVSPRKSDDSDLFKKVGDFPNKPEVSPRKSDADSDMFKKVGGSPIKSERSPSLEKRSEESGDLFKKVGGTTSVSSLAEKKQSLVRDSKPEPEPAVVPVKVAPLMSSPPSRPSPSHPSQSPGLPPLSSTPSSSSKPVPTKRRLLPAPPQEGAGQVLSPELQRKKVTMGDIGKQNSTASAVSVLSEMSTTMETDSAMDSPTSVTSSGSGGSSGLGRFPPVVSPSELAATQDRPPSVESDGTAMLGRSRQLSRRNATRSSGRPTRRPQGMIVDDREEMGSPPTTTTVATTAEHDASELQDSPEGGSPRMRSRSGAVRRPGKRPVRPQLRGSAGSSELKASVAAMDFPDFLGGEGDPESSLGGRSRSRGSRVTNQDRGLARVARETAARERSETPPRIKADGQFGSISMTLSYDEVKEELNVTVHSCKGLRIMDKNGSSDPYVKLFLQPRSKLQKFRTRTIFRNLNPTFDESFTFAGICKEALSRKKLCAVVMDYDELTKDDLIGGTQINLYEVVGSTCAEICIKRLLDDRSVPKHELIIKDRGLLHFGLRYSSEAKALVVSVISARNIASHSVQGQCETYVKCQWTSRGKTTKLKTKTCSKAADPVFNEDLEIPAALRDLTYCTLTLGLWERRSIKDKHLGEVQLNSVTFWKEFTHDPSKEVDDWFSLESQSHTHHLPSPTGRLSN